MVKVVVDREGLLYSDWLPLTAGNSTGFIGLINTFRGVFRTKGITIMRPLITGTTLFLRIPNFPRPGVTLRGSWFALLLVFAFSGTLFRLPRPFPVGL